MKVTIERVHETLYYIDLSGGRLISVGWDNDKKKWCVISWWRYTSLHREHLQHEIKEALPLALGKAVEWAFMELVSVK